MKITLTNMLDSIVDTEEIGAQWYGFMFLYLNPQLMQADEER